jgi:transposase-like protein
MSTLSKLPFHSEVAAFEYLERTLWPFGPVCPHCGTVGQATKLDTGHGEGKRQARAGLWQCNESECRKQFTVKLGTVFEHGRIPLHKMLQAVYLLCCSKKGCSSHQLHRILGITYKAAWFLSHRIREAMRSGQLAPMGGPGGVVETDETYIGKQEGHAGQGGPEHKNIVLTLVERGGEARSFHVDSFSVADVAPIIRKNIRKESRFMTDEAQQYRRIGKLYAEHGRVEHTVGEYVRAGTDIHTNTVEGYYSIFKRGMKGVYQHCSEKHLHRYLAEFDFRYSNRVRLGIDDVARMEKALQGIAGKRLTYRAADR